MKKRKALCIALVLLLSVNLLQALAAPKVDCPPGDCMGMTGKATHSMASKGKGTAPHGAEPSHGCCATSQGKACDMAARYPADPAQIQKHALRSIGANRDSIPTPAISGSHAGNDFTAASRRLPNHTIRTTPRSSPIYLRTLSLLI